MILDGKTYHVNSDSWKAINEKIGTSRVTISGRVDRTEARAFLRAFEMTCQVKATSTDPDTGTLATLRTSYNKTDCSLTGGIPNNVLDFTDPEGVRYDPAPGSDTATHIYDCGVYFELMGPPQNLSPTITGVEATFYVPILLKVAKVEFTSA